MANQAGRRMLGIAMVAAAALAVIVVGYENPSITRAAPAATFDPITSSSFGTPSAFPSVVTGGDGVYHAVGRTDGGAQAITYRQSRDGGLTWVTAARFAGEAGGATRPSIAVSGQRVAVAFIGSWCESATLCHEAPYLVSSSNGGATWNSPVRLDQRAFEVYVAVDADRTWVTWDRGGSVEIRGTANGGSSFFASRSVPGGSGPFVAAADRRAVIAWSTGSGPRAVVAVDRIVGLTQLLGGAETTFGSWSSPVAAADGRVHVLLKTSGQLQVAAADQVFGQPTTVMASGYSGSIAARRGVVAVSKADADGVTWVATSSDGGVNFSRPVPVVSTPGGEPLVEVGVATRANDRPVARFSWAVDDRYTMEPSGLRYSANALGGLGIDRPDMTVHLNGCRSLASPDRTIAQYRWIVDGTELAGTTCEIDLETTDGALSRVRLEVEDSTGVVNSVSQDVQPEDLLVVSIGDSIASGEGNPHVGGLPRFPNPVYETWENDACHRSARSGPALAAAELEDADPHSSVTFLHLACSGAAIMDVPELAGTAPSGPDDPDTGGLLDQYHGIDPAGAPARPSQLDQLRVLVGQRPVDALLVSVGANDIKFSQVVKECIVSRPTDPRPCHTSGTASRVEARLGTLPQRYEMLANAIGGLGIAANRVHITEYFDPTIDSLGLANLRCVLGSEQLAELAGYASDLAGAAQELDPEPATKVILEVIDYLGQVTAAALDGGLVTDTETAWARSTVVAGLNGAVSSAAATHGWNFVGGIATAFDRHGYCADDSWVVGVVESIETQVDLDGAVHPDRRGHEVYRDAIFRSLRSRLLLPATPDAGLQAGRDAVGDIYVVTATRTTVTASVIRDTGITPVVLRSRRLDRLVGGEGYTGPGGRPAADEASAVAAWMQVDAGDGALPSARAAQIVIAENASVRRVSIVQAPINGTRVVADRDSVVFASVDARLTRPQTVDVTTEVYATESGGSQRRVTRVTEPVRLVPGLNDLLLPTSSTFRATEGETLSATVDVTDPLGADPDDTYDNVGSTSPDREPTTVATRPVKTVFVSAAVPGAAAVSCGGVARAAQRMVQFANDAVPVPADGVVAGVNCIEMPVVEQSEPGALELLADLDQLARLGAVDAIVAVVPDGWLQTAVGAAVGAAASGVRGVIVEASAPSVVFAHEYAHTIGLVHINGVPAAGANIRTRRVPTGIDWMNEAAVEKTWTGGVTWEQMIDGIGGPSNAPMLPDPSEAGFWVRGSVSQNALGKWTVGPATWTPYNSLERSAPDLDDLELERLVVEQVGADGKVIGAPQPVGLGEAGGLYAPGTSSTPSPIGLMFATRVVLDTATVEVRLRLDDGEPVETRRVNGPPIVAVTSPAAGATVARGADLTVTWTSSDPDGDSLTTDLLVSDDGGVTWGPLASSVTGASHSITVPADLDGTSVRVRVVVSDGTRSAMADSPSFSVDGGGGSSAPTERLVFQRDRSFAGPTGASRLWTMNPDGTVVQEMALPLKTTYPAVADVQYSSPSWGPDGRVYFSSDLKTSASDGGESGEFIYSARPDGSDLRRISSARSAGSYWGTNEFGQSLGGYYNTCPTVSPDGQALAWIGWQTNGGVNAPRVWVARRAGDGWGVPTPILTAGAQSALTLHPSFPTPLAATPELNFTPESGNRCPRWTPDSTALVLVGTQLAYRPEGTTQNSFDASPVIRVGADGAGLRVVSPKPPFVQGTGAYVNFQWQTEWNRAADWDAKGTLVVQRGFEDLATFNPGASSGSSPKTYGVFGLDPNTGTFSAITPSPVSYMLTDIRPGSLKVAPNGLLYGDHSAPYQSPCPASGGSLGIIDTTTGLFDTVAAVTSETCPNIDRQFDWGLVPGSGAPPVEVVTIPPTPPAPPADPGGPYAVARDELITLDAGASNLLGGTGGATAAVTWDLDGDGDFDDAIGVRPTVSFPVVGMIPIRVRIVAGTDTATSEPTDVVVSDPPPPVPAPPAPGADDTPLEPLAVPVDMDVTIPTGTTTPIDFLPHGAWGRIAVVTPPHPVELSVASPVPAGAADPGDPAVISGPDGVLMLTPGDGFTGPTSFQIAALGALDVTATITVTIVGNRPPTANPDALTVQVGLPTVVAASLLIGNDTDPDAAPGEVLSLASVDASTNGDAWLDTENQVHVVAASPGSGSVRYVVADAGGAIATGTLQLTVEQQAVPPTTSPPTTAPSATSPEVTPPAATVPAPALLPTAGPDTAAPAAPATVPSGGLPATGSDSTASVQLAVLVSLIGVALVGVSRRRRRTSGPHTEANRRL